MGIFSRTPKIPEPTIIVELDEASRGSLRPGSQVAGLATAQSPVQRQLHSARIFFTGWAITRAYRTENNGNSSRTIYYNDDAELFMIDQIVSQNTVLEENIPYTWRFDFCFPSHTAEVLSESPYAGNKSSRKGIYLETGHELPPTFHFERSSHSQAKVEYSLQAEFSFEDALNKSITIPLEPLNFCPARPMGDFNALVEYKLPTKSYASSRLIGGEKSMMNSIKDRFSGSTPSLNVQLKASFPSHLSPGSNFPIYAVVELDQFSHDDISIEAITLRCKSITLYPITFWRALRVRARSKYDPEAQRDNEEKVALNAVPESAVARAQRDEYSKGKVGFPAAFEARIPGDMCPNFQTFNVVTAYRLKVVMEADVQEKMFQLKAEGTVTLLPP